jgi:uncharacterized protein YdeI (BOF family)
MHKFLVILIFASAFASSNAMAQDAGIIPPTVPPAPVGHAQPTARSFTLNSAADESERRRLSAFDAEQHKLDEMLDSKLNICRC